MTTVKYPFKEHSVKITVSKDTLEKHGIKAPFYQDGFGFPVPHKMALRYQKQQLRRAKNPQDRILIQDYIDELQSAILKVVKS